MSEMNNEMKEETLVTPVEETAAAKEVQAAPAEQPPQEPPKKKGWIWGIVAAAVIVVLIILGAVFGRSTPKQKVEQAMKNTFSHKSLFLEEMNQWKGTIENDYTVGMDIVYDGEQLAFEGRLTDEVFQVWAKANIQDVPELEFWVNVTNTRLEANISELEDILFTYNFREPKSGFLLDYITEEDLEVMDEILIQLSDLLLGEDMKSAMAKQEEANQKLTQVFLDVYANMEFEETDSASYEVKGKTLECKGYTAVLTSETLREMLKEIEAVYEEYELDYWTNYEEYGEYYGDPFETLDEALQGTEDMKAVFYLAEKQVAAIVLEIEGDTLELLFGSGDDNTWSMEIVYQEENVMTLESKVEGTVETITLEMEEVPVAILTYDSGSGRYNLNVEYYMPLLAASGVFEFTETEFTITVDEITSEYLPYEITFNYYGKSGAEIKELTGEEFDFTDADDADLMALYMMLEQSSLFAAY